MAVTFTKPAVDVDADDDELFDAELGEGEEEDETDSPAPAGVFAQLLPYLPTRYIATVLCSGSVALSRRGLAWVTAGGWKVTRGRLGGLAVAGYVACYEETHGQLWVLPVACGAWIVGALVHSPTTAAPAADEEDQEDDDAEEFEGETAAASTPPAAAPLPRRVDLDLVARLAHQLAGAADSANSRGVQLDHLVAHLAGVPKDALLATLKAADIPVRDVKYRLSGGRQQVRQGVRLEHLPAVSGGAPATTAPGLHAVPAPAAPGGPAEGASAGPADPSPTPVPDPSLRAG